MLLLNSKCLIYNREADVLSKVQIDYAANDAFFSREIYLKLLSIPYQM